MTKWRIGAVAAAMIIAGTSTGATQIYPNRVIKAVVPYTAGGPIDVVSRIVAKRLGDVLGHPIIVENRPGASARGFPRRLSHPRFRRAHAISACRKARPGP